jgi:hypothetical protein
MRTEEEIRREMKRKIKTYKNPETRRDIDTGKLMTLLWVLNDKEEK